MEEELGKRQGQRTDLVSEDQEEMFGELPINCKEVAGKQSAAIAAEKAGFDSEATYRRAKTVTENATPELIEAMDKGDIAISTAAKLAGQPPDVQREAATNPKAAIDLAKKASAVWTVGFSRFSAPCGCGFRYPASRAASVAFPQAA